MKTTSTLKISAVKTILRNTFLTVVVLPVAPAVAANNCHVYEVTIQGTTSIGEGGSTLASQQFSVVQYAAWRETGFNGHPFEFVLTPGQDLNASPKVGFIELGTNTRFANNAGIRAAAFNLTTASVQNGAGVFQLDSSASYQLPSPNVFVAPGYSNVPGGLGGLCFLPNSALCGIVTGPSVLSASYIVPRSGSGYFYLTDSRGSGIGGQVVVTGSSTDNAQFQGEYKAQFSGKYVADMSCN